MAYDIGPKLGIDGYAEFRKAITSINDDVKNFGSELKLVAAIYDENGDSMEALAAKNDLLQKTYDAQEKKIAEVEKVLERAKAEYGENESVVKKWSQVLIESRTALQKTQNEMDKNSRAMEELGKAAEDSADAFDGFKDIEKAVDDIDDEIKTLATELRAVASAYDETDKGSKGFKESQQVLIKQIDAQKEKLEKLQDGLQQAQKLYGENDSRTREWARAVNTATAELNDLSKELDSGSKGLSQFAAGLKDSLKMAAGNLLSSGVSAVVSGAQQAISAFVNLDETTEEYRVAMGKLNAAFEAAGYSAEAASRSYEGLYEILGDTDTAAETVQLMAQLADSEEDFAQWTKIAAGVAGTFGDALPINSLIEAANETAKVGEVTGALADALNWAGLSEDEFNAKLAECTSESERNDLIMGTLTDTYKDAADAFYQNNEELIKSRENQAKLDEVTGRLGKTVSDVKNTMMEKFGPAITEIGEDIADFIEGVDTDKLFRKFEVAWDDITIILGEVPDYLDSLWDIACGTFETVDAIWRGDFDAAWQSVKGVFSDAWDFFSDLGEDIADAMAAGVARRNREKNKGTFGQDTDRVGAVGGTTQPTTPSVHDPDGVNGASGASPVTVDDLQAALNGMGIYMSGQRVGDLTTISQRNNARARGTA